MYLTGHHPELYSIMKKFMFFIVMSILGFILLRKWRPGLRHICQGIIIVDHELRFMSPSKVREQYPTAWSLPLSLLGIQLFYSCSGQESMDSMAWFSFKSHANQRRSADEVKWAG